MTVTTKAGCPAKGLWLTGATAWWKFVRRRPTFVLIGQACDPRWVSDTSPPMAPASLRPALLWTEANGNTELCLNRPPSQDAVELACQALRELLPMDVHQRSHRRFPIDGDFSWELQWTRNQLTVQVVDPTGALWGQSVTVSPGTFVDGLYEAALELPPNTLRALERLRRWVLTLGEADIEPAPGLLRTVTAPDAPALASEPASVDLRARGELRHLAYRAHWSALSVGPIAVFSSRDRIQLFDREGVHILERETGERVGFQPGLYPAGAPSIALDADARLTAFDADGGLRWRSIPAVEAAPQCTVSTGEIILIEAEHAILTAYDARTGTLRWRHRAFEGGERPSLITGEVTWRLPNDGFLYCLRNQDGRLLARRRLLGRPVAPVIETPHGLLTTTAVDDALHLSHFALSDGHRQWQRRIRGRLATAPVSFDSGVALVAERDGHQVLHVLDNATGHQRSHHFLNETGACVRLDAVDGRLLIKGATGSVHAFSQGEGTPLWNIGPDPAQHGAWARLSPVSTRGLLLCAAGSIRAVDPATGRIIQRLDCTEDTPEWINAYSNGDLLILEDEALRLFRLHGHLSILR